MLYPRKSVKNRSSSQDLKKVYESSKVAAFNNAIGMHLRLALGGLLLLLLLLLLHEIAREKGNFFFVTIPSAVCARVTLFPALIFNIREYNGNLADFNVIAL